MQTFMIKYYLNNIINNNKIIIIIYIGQLTLIKFDYNIQLT